MSATARVTGHARHTIARWLERASTAAKRFNQRLLRDFEILELQADELCTFIGNKSRATWWCAAIAVCSRLWAGSVLGRRSSRNATAVLNDVILRGRVVGFPLIATEGFEYDVGVSERLFGSACVYGQVLKTRRNDRVVRVERRRRIGALVRGCGQAYALQTVEPVTYRCGTRRVCQARSSGSERYTRARPHAVAPMNCVPEDSRRRSTCTGRTHSPRARADGNQTPSSTVAVRPSYGAKKRPRLGRCWSSLPSSLRLCRLRCSSSSSRSLAG